MKRAKNLYEVASRKASGLIASELQLFPFDKKLHEENRLRLLSAVKKPQQHIPKSSKILFKGGVSMERNDTDHEEIFRQESNFCWLFGVKEPNFFGLLDVDSEASFLFIPRLSSDYAIWMGPIRSCKSFQEEYGVTNVYYVDEMVDFLKEGAAKIYTIKGMNTDSKRMSESVTFEGSDGFVLDESSVIFDIICNLRAHKTDKEIALMRHVNQISSAAHLYVMKNAKVGMKEFQLESLFQHFCYFLGGCRHTSYTSICGCGPNSAILHYGHAAQPNDKTIEDGEFCLLDMGSEWHCYGADITCTFPINGKFTKQQRIVYEIVLECQKQVMQSLKPGVNYLDMQKLCFEIILQGLTKEAKLLKGDLREMMEHNLGAVFMPHGLGHLLGIDTHDVGGKLNAIESPLLRLDGYNRLRFTRSLEERMIITVEPGCYFIDHLLQKALSDENKKRFFDLEVLEQYRRLGGVRLEDDVLITSTGCENLTDCLRSVEEIEKFMQNV